MTPGSAEPVAVVVPGSCANLGPGFDALAMAVDVRFELGWDPGLEAIPGFRAADERHPEARAFRSLGGVGPLFTRFNIPIGRGLGFSGAARVAGVAAAAVQSGGSDAIGARRQELLRVASELEGHADNVAASLVGGVVATAAGRVVPIAVPVPPVVLAWVPDQSTSTDDARARLPGAVPFADAVFNVGRTALLVAALAAGDVAALRDATADRLHTDVRLGAAPGSRVAIEAALDAGAWAAFLSGSGPTVAVWCSAELADAIEAALPADGAHVKRLALDALGARVATVR